MGKAFDRVSRDRDVTSFKLGPCKRCGHSPDWHRKDDADNVDVTSPEAKFRCIGYDCEKDGTRSNGCTCPDYVDNITHVHRLASR